MATVRQAERAIQAFEHELSSYPNVVGLGIRALDEDRRGGGRREVAVAVYVTRKLPESRLAKKDRIPPYLVLESRGRTIRVATRVIEQGEVTLE